VGFQAKPPTKIEQIFPFHPGTSHSYSLKYLVASRYIPP